MHADGATWDLGCVNITGTGTLLPGHLEEGGGERKGNRDEKEPAGGQGLACKVGVWAFPPRFWKNPWHRKKRLGPGRRT